MNHEMINLEELPIVCMKVDPEGVIQEANSLVASYFGNPSQFYIGKIFFDCFNPSLSESPELFLPPLHQEGVLCFEHTFQTSLGEEKYFCWQIYKMKDGGRLCFCFDMTLCKVKIDKLSEEKAEAIAVSFAKTHFIAHTSHELRTPLNAVIGYSEMLLEEIDEIETDEIKADLQKINGAAQHLLSLINKVLDLTKIESGRMELFNEEFDVMECLMEVGATVETLVRKGDNTLDVICPDNLGNMYADRTKLREILFNLLSNACKFTENGHIRLEGRLDKGLIIFEVHDTGVGISKEDIQKLFIPFSQVGEQKKMPGTGTGLGLLLCKRFADLMGGRIYVESKVGCGSLFRLELPLVHRSAIKKRESDVILVIDDDPSVHAFMNHIAKKEKLKLVSSMLSKDGLRLAKECHPLVIVLDLIMPEMDGWEVLRLLKSDPETKDIPVIISTVDSSGSKHRLAMKVDDYLIKPINSALMSSILRRYRSDEQKSQQTVMVVDDDPQARQIISHIASKDGWSIVEAENGKHALEKLKTVRPNLILLDLVMPVMNGLEFVHHFRQNSVWQKIPIVVLTSKDLSEEERSFLSGTTHAVLSKQNGGFEQVEELIHQVAYGETACSKS